MIVCLCRASSDKDISRAIGSGAHSVEQVGRNCGAGTGCGACVDTIRGMLDQAQARCPGTGCGDCMRACEAA